MNRQEKYSNTETFYYYNRNPKNRLTTDCVIRAISTALEIPYEKVLREMAEVQIDTGYDMSSPKCIDLYLKKKGWIKCAQPRKHNGKKFTGKEFCEVQQKWLERKLLIFNE